jgi:carbonic anhydrase
MYRWLKGRGLEGCYDLVCLPGASKDFGERGLAEAVRLAVDLHGINEVYLVHHEDCGAYRLAGWEGDPQVEAQQRDARLAAHKIRERHPQLTVRMLFLRLGSQEPEEWF